MAAQPNGHHGDTETQRTATSESGERLGESHRLPCRPPCLRDSSEAGGVRSRDKVAEQANGDNAHMLSEAGALFDEAGRFLDGDGETPSACRRTIARARDGCATILVAGLKSTGKSSLVSALWGDSELLPTAIRDCTQTNTLIRTVREGELDRKLVLNFLTRDGSEEFAARGVAFHRLREVIAATLGPAGPKLDEVTPGARVRLAVDTVRRLFSEREDVHVLYEPATEQLEQLEQFIAHLDSPEYVPGGRVEKDWAERREYLMGRRRRDGRTLDTGKLLSLRLVELVRATDRWGDLAPTVIDTPWVPTFHNARRADLVLREAERADIIVITALPEPFELEPWVREVFKKRPYLRGRTLVVFNQVDTVDTSCLFGRGGFAEAWAGNVERLGREGVPPGNLYVCCARLPFLEGLQAGRTRDPFEAEREERLRAVLGKIRALAESSGPSEGPTTRAARVTAPDSMSGALMRRAAPSGPPAGRASDGTAGLFRERLLAACDPADCGVESLRSRLAALAAREVRLDRARDACEAMLAVDELELDAGPQGPSGVSGVSGQSKPPGGWPKVRARAVELLRQLRALTPEASSGHGKRGRRSPTLGDGRPLFKE